MLNDGVDMGTVLNRFNRLIAEVLRGEAGRTTFREWEVRLLVDIHRCDDRSALRRGTLLRYQKAVQRHVEQGRGMPFPLSEYLSSRKARRRAR